MLKAKKYDWKDSNLALFGSDTEKKVKKESAESEPAWQGAGEQVGVQIWRIVKFKVTSWTKEEYGKFYNGDSYIILNTYKEPDGDELKYDVHFWIGAESTQDEYGTAAYKTVELDTLLDDKPIQHREVQNHESSLFKSYFPRIELLKGGADTGFRRVEPTTYKPRLLHFSGTRKKILIKEVSLKRSNVISSDVFILDLGLMVYQWNGSSCNKDEKFKAVQFIQQLKSERYGKPKVETLDEAEIGPNHPFYSHLPEDGDDDDDDDDDTVKPETPVLIRLSDASGTMEYTTVKEGKFEKSDLDSNDVFIADTPGMCFVWIGKGASIDERKNCMTYAHNYLGKTEYPFNAVTIVSENQESKEFNAIFQ